MKTNCWNIMECGREEGGNRTMELGICPAATSKDLEGTNSGDCGGRACWKVKEMVNGKIIPRWSDPNRNCLSCEVFQLVRSEEKDCFLL